MHQRLLRRQNPPGWRSEILDRLVAHGLDVPPYLKINSAEAPDAAKSEALAGLLSQSLAEPALFAIRDDGAGLTTTINHIGLSRLNVDDHARTLGDQARGYADFARFLASFAEFAYRIDPGPFADLLDDFLDRKGVIAESELDADDWRRLCDRYEGIIEDVTGARFPSLVTGQLEALLGEIKGPLVLQVTVPDTVKGQKSEFRTRDVNSGAPLFAPGQPSLESKLAEQVEAALSDAAWVAFIRRDTGEESADTHAQAHPWVLDVRRQNRSQMADVAIAVDLAGRGVISRQEAIQRIDPLSLEVLLHPRLSRGVVVDLLTKGVPASPGAVSGALMLNAKQVEKRGALGEKLILVRPETASDDVYAMSVAVGVITARGGPASHAAAVARGMGRPCVVGAADISVDDAKRQIRIRDEIIKEGEIITIDGASGNIMRGAVDTVEPELSGALRTLLEWADEERTLHVRANADMAKECQTAIDFGAEGVGLCRTEHLFFETSRLVAMRHLILSKTREERSIAVERILPMQRQDFEEIFAVVGARPVCIRLLDPPLHEFLPRTDEEFQPVADVLGVDIDRLKRRAARMVEANPMLGHRGCRLGLTYPEIYEMQVAAILGAAEAAQAARRAAGQAVGVVEIMIPLVAWPEELAQLERRLSAQIEASPVEAVIGTMIELPRAALLAGEIAQHSAFFSFGTNDLTQTTFGISRDDATAFLKSYEQDGLIEVDPFRSLDQTGVGELVRIGVERGRASNPALELGICGEHGGDPESIRFCQAVGLDYVSCSPYRVPIARLAAAQAAISAAATKT